MTRFANSRRFWPFVALLCLVAAGVVACLTAGAHRPEPSDIYCRYAPMPGVDATFVKAYPVNDTLSVDVTLLQATDTAAWRQLIDDLGYKNHHIKKTDTTSEKKEYFSVVLSQRYYTDTAAKCEFIGVASAQGHYICIFHYTDAQTWDGFFDAVFKRALLSLKNKEDIVNKTVINKHPNTTSLSENI